MLLRSNYIQGVTGHYRDRLSGQLLGEEIITMVKLFNLKVSTPLYVIGDKPSAFNLTSRYLESFRAWGFDPKWLDGRKLTLEGLLRIRKEYLQGINNKK